MNSQKFVTKTFNDIGITINGDGPIDIQVYNNRFYSKLLREASLGLAESYMDGWWGVKELDLFIKTLLSADLNKSMGFYGRLYDIWSHLFNMQSKRRSHKCANHYNIGNDLYELMLDDTMAYTCGYWEGLPNSSPEYLKTAQLKKFNLVCKKLNFKKGDSVLDIGCGWGGFAEFAAKHYGVVIDGITISPNQLEYAKKHSTNEGVRFFLKDYRDLSDQYDYIVSIGMFEHVGYKNYRNFFETAYKCLKPDGLFLLHTIGGNKSVYSLDAFFQKYLFPVGMIPSIAQVGKAVEGLFVMENLQNFGLDYVHTLKSWWHNFDSNWDKLCSKYNERFYRFWKYYLLCSAGIFWAREEQLWQIIFSKNRRQRIYYSWQ